MLLDMLFSGTSSAETEQTAMLLGKLLQNAETYIDAEENL